MAQHSTAWSVLLGWNVGSKRVAATQGSGNTGHCGSRMGDHTRTSSAASTTRPRVPVPVSHNTAGLTAGTKSLLSVRDSGPPTPAPTRRCWQHPLGPLQRWPPAGTKRPHAAPPPFHGPPQPPLGTGQGHAACRTPDAAARAQCSAARGVSGTHLADLVVCVSTAQPQQGQGSGTSQGLRSR